MFTAHIDVARAKSLLDGIVRRFGADHTATREGQSCIYVEIVNGRPEASCIVGQVIADFGLLGVLLHDEPADRYDGSSDPSQYGACYPDAEMWDDLASAGLNFDEDARNLLRHAQAAQDDKAPWGRAVAYAAEMHVWEQANVVRRSLGLPRDYEKPVYTLPDDGLAEWERELLDG